jgi:hypothetical protein
VKKVPDFRFHKQDRQDTYKRNIDVHSSIRYCSGKAISIAYSGCVIVALDIQHAKRMRHRARFSEKMLFNIKMRLFIFFTTDQPRRLVVRVSDY